MADVAELLNMHRSTVHRWLNDQAFLRELALLRDKLFERAFDLQSYGAVQGTLKLIEFLSSEDPRIVLSAAGRLAALKLDYAAIDRDRRLRRIEDQADLFKLLGRENRSKR